MGLPELFGRKKRDIFTSIVDKIRQRACSWSSRFLSTAGKMIMLKSVLSAMPSYTMTCFKIPNSLCKRIQSALTRFWGDTKMDQKKMCWVSWKKLTKGKAEGGLGFRDLQSFNDALLAKSSWRILTNPSCLLAKILLGKYCHFTPFLDSKVPSSASHGWRGICIGKELLKSQLGRIVGNGKSTSIWNDPWLSLSAPSTPMGPAPEQYQNLTVNSLISPVSLEWDREKIHQILPEAESEILDLKISKFGAPDIYAWLPTKSGEYTAKSGYHESIKLADESTPHHDSNSGLQWKSEVWNIKCSPKIKLFLWKILKEALPVGENLRNRSIVVDAGCPFCGEPESSLHLFFKCRFATQIWALAPFKIPVDPDHITCMKSGIEVSKHLTCLPPSGIANGPLLPWILWKIWLARNRMTFDKRHDPPADTLTQAISLAREWQSSQVVDPPPVPPGKKPRTIQLDPDTITCHTDAAWHEPSRSGGLGWIFTDHQMNLRRKGTRSVSHVRSPLIAEAMAIYSALSQAVDLGFTNLIIASDCKQLIDDINAKNLSKELHGILHDIHSISSSFLAIRFIFVSRKNNVEADALAKQTLKNFVTHPV